MLLAEKDHSHHHHPHDHHDGAVRLREDGATHVHDHSGHDHSGHDHAGHGHAGHGHARTSHAPSRFRSLIALSGLQRLMLALPVIAVLWLMAFWAMGWLA
jgi:hypothetical protein